MKKLLLAVVLGLLIVAAFTTLALADNGPHGGFSATTDACAGCHRAHSARVGANSLLRLPITELCMSCHAGGLGASTDVDNGVYTTNASTGTAAEGTVGNGLFGGGFTNAVMTTTWNGSTTGGTVAAGMGPRGTTSTHQLDTAAQTVWGAGTNNAAVSVNNGSTMTLECTSCHDPHGKAGWDISTTPDTRVASYRLLRWQPEGSDGFASPGSFNWTGGAFPTNDATTPVSGWLVPDAYATTGGEWYTVGTAQQAAPNDYLPGASGNNAYRPGTFNYSAAAINTGFFCAQCHDRYFNNSSLRNDADSITSAYCAVDAGGNPVANPTYTTNPADVAGASPTNPMLFPATQNHPDPAKLTDCVAQVSYSSRYPGPTNILASWGDARPSGDALFMFRHSSGDVRLSADGTVAQSGTAFSSIGRTCLVCHVSHGTAARADAVATDGVDAGAAVNLATITTSNLGGSLHGGSVLLRMDGRTLCIRCHADAVNFTTIP